MEGRFSSTAPETRPSPHGPAPPFDVNCSAMARWSAQFFAERRSVTTLRPIEIEVHGCFYRLQPVPSKSS
jgi:hypothetical protein